MMALNAIGLDEHLTVMDDFPLNLIKAFEQFTTTVQTVQLEVEQLVTELAEDVNEAVESAVDTLMLVSEEMTTQVQTTAVQVQSTWDEELEPFLNQLMVSLFNLPLEFNFPLEDGIDRLPLSWQSSFLAPPIAPTHPLCQTCRHYHGQSYGGTLLVCGMHPYGISEGQPDCADHEVGSRYDRSQDW
ncbi:MAG: hypothetical protein VKJ24_03150 [Synechococcales bacterium]|nr:hypothetical protein [Synechococcales bacterium]